MGGERRASLRKSISQPAGLYHPDGKPICDCVMRDISETGARLKIAQSDEVQDRPLPPKFILAISRNGNVFRRCELVWRQGNEIGVAFARLARMGK